MQCSPQGGLCTDSILNYIGGETGTRGTDVSTVMPTRSNPEGVLDTQRVLVFIGVERKHSMIMCVHSYARGGAGAYVGRWDRYQGYASYLTLRMVNIQYFRHIYIFEYLLFNGMFVFLACILFSGIYTYLCMCCYICSICILCMYSLFRHIHIFGSLYSLHACHSLPSVGISFDAARFCRWMCH